MGEVLSLPEAADRRSLVEGIVVFTNGVFDILHRGHVEYLNQAKKLGEILIVGVNSDNSARRLKGPGRPFNSEEDRAFILANLKAVDFAVIFDQPTPFDLINTLQPDIIVKGGDYRPDEVVGKDIVEQRGGKVVIIPLSQGKSTTGTIDKIMKSVH